ncbi:hypothetical protein TSMEX_010535 [Taenia solium]
MSSHIAHLLSLKPMQFVIQLPKSMHYVLEITILDMFDTNCIEKAFTKGSIINCRGTVTCKHARKHAPPHQGTSAWPILDPSISVLMSSNTYLFLPILLYLIFPLHHPTEAAVIEDRRKPWSYHDLQQIGNALLKNDKLVASFLDKVELSVSIPPDSSNKRCIALIEKKPEN